MDLIRRGATRRARHRAARQHPRRWARATIIGLGAIGLAACQPNWILAPTPTGSPKANGDARGAPCSVAIVGDSLSVGVERFGAPAAHLARRGCALVRIDARSGRTVGQGAEVVEQWAGNGDLPEVLVVILGTNNCSYESMSDGVRRILDAVGPDRAVVWQNTYRSGCDGPVNQALADQQSADLARPHGGRLWVIDHRSIVAANPRLVSDGIHMGPQGYRDSAVRIADAVSRVIVK